MSENLQKNQEIKDKKQNIPFNSLSPVSDPEKHKFYCDSLEWALSNRKEKDIKNIALSGTYGSGKSSILKTFQKTNKNESLKFLNVSLATFKEEKRNDTDKYAHLRSENINSDKLSKNDQLRLVELSILQQIFYHEEYDNIPDSRFKKIRSLNPKEVQETTWLVFGLIFVLYTFFNFHFLRTLINLPEPKLWFAYIVQGLLAIGGLVLSFYFLRAVVGFSQKLTISKLNFQNLEIQVADKIDKSILNNHLDEILYFFEVTDYNVVIIEDLDRFEQTEIFTKLREINLLINNSKSINRTVTFIYAIRDEMFKDKDRTKFFDFIIPVIPVINYSNSNEQLTRALEKFDYSLSTELIDQVAFYVDDMRLLYNIVNEFHIYFQKFKGEKYQNKLFAIIVYKNIYPEDFVMLGKNQGILYKNLVENKLDWVNSAIEKIEEDNSSLKIELKTLEESLPRNLEELKRIYLFEYIQKVPNLMYFKIQNKNYTVQQMLEEENFEKLKSGSISYRESQYTRPFNFKFSDVESRLDPEKSYLERKTEIESKNTGRVKDIRDKLKKNEEENRRIKNAKIKYLLKDKKIALSSEPSKQEQLIILLIRNGYIAEDYLNYISYFYPGSITERDHWFLMNVRNEMDSKFDYKLDEVENVIKKISESEFERRFVLNYSLLDQFLKSKKFPLKKELFLKQLSNESNDSVKFIYSYIKEGKNSGLFIKALCKSWIDIWKFIEEDSSLSEDDKSNYLSLLLNNAEIEDIEKIASTSQLEAVLNQKADFLSIVNDPKKQIQIIDQFDLKFTSLNLDESSEEIKEYIYSMNNYAINTYMLKRMIKEFGEYREDDFNRSNYAAIHSSGCDKLIEYIEKNIEKYISSVYLKLKDNFNEKQEYLLKLLNNSNIKKTSKEDIISQTETLLPSISELEDSKELSDFLLKNLKIEPTWKNVIFNYQENENKFSETLTGYLNNPKIAEVLVKESIPTDKELVSFRRDFLLNNKIQDELYNSYLKTVPLAFKDLNFEDLSFKKVEGLVNELKLSFNQENHTKLRSSFSPTHLIFIILNISEFFKIFSEIVLSESDLAEILENSMLSDSHKIKLIEKFEADNAISDQKALSLIGKMALKHKELKLSDSNISSILLKSALKTNEKIELFMNNLTSFDKEFIKPFLNSLGGDYKQLNAKGPMPYFKNSALLLSFFQYLKQEDKISKIKEKKDHIQVTTFRK
ncbi:hypothetical protein [Salegentibacter sp. UBA1130]|uniref:YobI family P-loop NTPase n=1 Tax=Salegentibacter sp. UBA1130 TaxID=1947451 RepID=UPI00257B16ED|nr:hypothetical protein [Salegentibacter sp. UBA1130]